MLRANSDSDFSFFCCFLVIFVDIVFRFGIVVMDPEFSDDQLDYYELEAKDFCLVNGLFNLKAASSATTARERHDSAAPLPVTLLPTAIPARQFHYALQIQKDFNKLIFDISNDVDFLKTTLKNVILVDDFTRRLWNICETIENEGGDKQPLSFAILRNDFMIDQNKSASAVWLSQIEINTISCSFGAATSHVARLHRHLLNRMNKHDILNKHVANENLSILADSLVKAWEMYENSNAKVLYLISDDERNIGDQRLLEYKCSELNSKLMMLRCSLGEVFSRGKLDDQNRLFIDGNEIALVYLRAGYDPKDYMSENEWSARLLIERSTAIKCPNIRLHLVGTKIVQQVLTEPGVLERFISDATIVESIRATFVDMYQININNLNEILEIIARSSEEFVLKPQREGGGNNIYKSDIKVFVDSLGEDKKELTAYVLMRLIQPQPTNNYVIKTGERIQKKTLISELGIFGTYIANGKTLVQNETGGYLLRTKSSEVNEGGVATGFSSLDSVYLEDN